MYGSNSKEIILVWKYFGDWQTFLGSKIWGKCCLGNVTQIDSSGDVILNFCLERSSKYETGQMSTRQLWPGHIFCHWDIYNFQETLCQFGKTSVYCTHFTSNFTSDRLSAAIKTRVIFFRFSNLFIFEFILLMYVTN